MAVHDYTTLKYRDRDSLDAAYKSKLEYFSSEGKATMTAKPIRVNPPAIRRRGVAMKPFYVAAEEAFPNVEIVQRHRTKKGSSASIFLVECAADDADEFVPVVTVLWRDDGSSIEITEVDIDGSAPKGLAKVLHKLSL